MTSLQDIRGYIVTFKLEKALVLSYALLSCRFAVNILLPVREPLSGFTQRVFGKTEKTIQLSPFSGEKGTAPILPVAIYQIEKKTFRAVKSGKHFFSFLFLPPLPPFFFFFLKGCFYVEVKAQVSVGWEKN